MKRERPYQEILWPVLLISLLVICFVLTTRFLWQLSVEECYYEIEQAADEASATLQHNLDLYQGNLELVAGMLTSERLGDPETLQDDLESFCKHQQIDAICVQLRDGHLICGGSTLPDYTALPAFSEMVQKAPCVSGRFPGVADSGAWFLYLAVPIRDDGQTIGILYGLMDLKQLPTFFQANIPYGGKGQFYLVDGDTGDFLMDMWHDTLGNLYDGSMGSRQTKPGYSLETMVQDIRSGRSGYFVFLSQTAGEYFYTRYQPAGINNWSINLTVMESVAFAETKEINQAIFFLGAVVTVLTVTYLILTFWQYHRRLHRKQSQIQQTTFMFEVQQILFDAHQNPSLIQKALEKVAREVDAEGAFLLAMHSSQVHRTSVWRREDADFVPVDEGNSLRQDFPQVYQHLLQNQSVLYGAGKEGAFPLSEQEEMQLRARKVHSMVVVPVLDANGVLHGILCVVNFHKADRVRSYVECVAHSFMMAMCNMESYQFIHDMGTLDALTGMKNRNSYENALDEYRSTAGERFCCSYIDVNGLHELNNQKGHKAGDAMLCSVAQQICAVFGSEHAYRIGGDEFVAFSLEETAAGLAEKETRLRSQVEAGGYHISVGSAGWQGGEHNLDELIARAEGAMYEDKRAFYQKYNRRGARR